MVTIIQTIYIIVRTWNKNENNGSDNNDHTDTNDNDYNNNNIHTNNNNDDNNNDDDDSNHICDNHNDNDGDNNDYGDDDNNGNDNVLLSEPLMFSLLTHKYVTRPWWIRLWNWIRHMENGKIPY